MNILNRKKLKEVHYDSFKEGQSKGYLDPTRWHYSTPVLNSQILRLIFRYSKILELFNLITPLDQISQKKIKILEPGCGPGFLANGLALLGDVWSFDYTPEAISLAKQLSMGSNIIFFEADGTRPLQINELKEKKFEFILMRGFHPLSRNIIGNPSPLEIIKEYYEILNKGGVVIIEDVHFISIWRGSEDILQVSKIVKELNGMLFYTLSLHVLLEIHFLAKYLKVEKVLFLSRLIMPLEFLFCYITKRRLSKTIIIKK